MHPMSVFAAPGGAAANAPLPRAPKTAWLALRGRIERWRWPLAMGLATIACLYAFWPIGTLIRGWNDSSFLYAAGRTWLSGFSPYDFERWNAEWAAVRPIADIVQPMPFVYPPHWGPIGALLAMVPWPVASRLWDGINVLAYVGACVFSIKLLTGDVRQLLATTPAVWVFLAVATLNVAVRQSIFQGQLTIVPLLGVVGAFWAWHHRRLGWLIVFGYLASLKPQLGLLPLLYIFLNGGHKGISLAALAAGGVAVLSMLPSGLEHVHADLSHVMTLHAQLEFNQPDQYFNVPALAARYLPEQLVMTVGPVLAIVLVIVMTVMRRRQLASAVLHDPLWQASIVMAVTGALMPLHAYDLVIYTPLALLAYRLRSSWMVLPLLVLILSGGRSHLFARYFDLQLPPPIVTTAVALTIVIAARKTVLRATSLSTGCAATS